MIGRQVDHLIRLIDDLLDVSRFATGQFALRLRRVELATVVAQAVELSAAAVHDKSHALRVAVPEHGMLVDCDVERLTQAISNVIVNAAKYTPPGGKIAVTAQQRDATLVIHVRDNGIGIAPEMLPRVFDLFVQEAQTGARRAGGLGLGLTIVRTLVGLHGGTVTAHSGGLGHGSEFVIELPAAALHS